MPIQSLLACNRSDPSKRMRSRSFNLNGPLPLVIVALALIIASGSGQANPQSPPSRIAVIDVQRVLRESVAGRAAFEKLKRMQDERLAKARQLDAEMRKLDGEMNSPTVTAARRTAIAQQLAEKRIAIKRFAEDADKEIGTTRDRELQTLEAKINPLVNAIGKEMGLAAIFNKFESGLIYASDSIDITNTMITRFNAASPAPPASPRNKSGS